MSENESLVNELNRLRDRLNEIRGLLSSSLDSTGKHEDLRVEYSEYTGVLKLSVIDKFNKKRELYLDESQLRALVDFADKIGFEWRDIDYEEIEEMRTDELFTEICKIETTMKCNFVDDADYFLESLRYLKDHDIKTYDKLVALYKEYYGETNDFWKDL